MTTTERINNRPAGMVSTTRIELADPYALGHWLAGRPSDEQAAFLFGLQSGFAEMGVIQAGQQLLYIRERADLVGFDLSNLSAMLNDYLEDQS